MWFDGEKVLKNGSRIVIEWPLASTPHQEKKKNLYLEQRMRNTL